MFRLTHYACTNSAGFRSGLGVKRVNLDLSTPERITKGVFVISGDNASGKSVLAESIHPFTTNTGSGRQRFFIEGKEGMITREYVDDDGTEVYTKMIYTPKSNGGHSTKSFFSIKKPGEEAVELNPTGNLSTYLNLVKTYFGITKEFVSFASYSEAVKGLVTETSYDRKNKISALIPNTNRFEVAYNTINEKYKTTRTMARQVAQKLLHLRDDETIRGELTRVEKEINEAAEHREDAVKKIAEYKGRIKTLAGTDDIDSVVEGYEEESKKILELSSLTKRTEAELVRLCRKYDIEPTEEEIHRFLKKAEKSKSKAQKAKMDQSSLESDLKTMQIRLNDVENELTEAESILYSLQTHDVEDMKENLKFLKGKIASMEYAKNMDAYKDMSYDEIVAFMTTIETIKNIVNSLYERYGQIFNDYFTSPNSDRFNAEFARKILDQTLVTSRELEDNMSLLNRNIQELYQYHRLKDTLEHRPKECHIDSCPFIQDALKWPVIEKKIEAYETDYAKYKEQSDKVNDKIKNIQLHIEFCVDVVSLIQMCEKCKGLFKKYLKLDIDKLYQSFASGTPLQELNLDELKRIAAILSEKELYERITKIDIPELQSTIELAKNAEVNREAVKNRVSRLREVRKNYQDEIDNAKLSLSITETAIVRYDTICDTAAEISSLWDEYEDSSKKQQACQEEYEQLGKTVNIILNLMDKMVEYQKDIRSLEETMRDLGPKRERLKYDLNQLNELKAEKAIIERDFTIIEIMRQIIAPGKGIWGECIALYMDDVRSVTNQLLLNMFGGNLYLDEFIITDKEFLIPYVHNGSEGEDVSMASSSQQAAISMALSLAIISKMAGNYGVCVFDEADAPMSPANKEMFAEILIKQAKYIGLNQLFVVTHSPEVYSGYDVCRINFPGARIFSDEETVNILEGSK